MASFTKGLLLLWISIACATADFSSCNSGSQGNLISASFSLSTNTIPVPGSFSASLNVTLNRTIDDNIRAEVEIRRPVLFWTVRVPCVGPGQGVGSCTYSDICSLLANSEASCNGQPCACPLAPGTYSFPSLPISTSGLHSAIARVARNTVFNVKIKFHDKITNELISCLRTQLVTRRG